MDRRELRKTNGDVYFEVEREALNSYIHLNWIGIQSIETIMMGSNQVLSMLRQKPCTAILNSNKELIGSWDAGALFMGSRWAFQVNKCGVIYFAQVMAPGIYGKSSFYRFEQLASPYFKIMSFTSEEEAKTWLYHMAEAV